MERLVLTHPKGDKRKYVTRSETQKVMGSTIAKSKAQTERNRKRRREGVEPEQPASAPLSNEDSEIKSEDAAKYMAKRRRKAEEERVKSKEDKKWGKKLPARRVKNVEIHLDEETVGIILEVPVVGIRTVEGCKPISDFLKLATKRGDAKHAGLPK
ncbi:hypothetical protein H5410_052074 [Solanum commersonii]|uniref:Uncharacterized protein n=1 Tax=Solanum commersonii TaxID=4109 RepID=A0A9J5X184_SOLCO|nr:hypothetical protein H5410_052074 [Solanum commersonii]